MPSTIDLIPRKKEKKKKRGKKKKKEKGGEITRMQFSLCYVCNPLNHHRTNYVTRGFLNERRILFESQELGRD